MNIITTTNFYLFNYVVVVGVVVVSSNSNLL